MNILILGASYGSLFATKLLLAGHNVTLVCRAPNATLINTQGTHVRIKLKGDVDVTNIHSDSLLGNVVAVSPDDVVVGDYDMACLAMQEPQYSNANVKDLMSRLAASKIPCLSIMNMPPMPYIRRIPGLEDCALDHCYSDPDVWKDFEPGLVSLCSPDPQAFRPPDEPANVLVVGLPTNFKAAAFADPAHTAMLKQLELDIDNVTYKGKEVPVKLKVHDSVFVPLAKWSMLMTGNFRCIMIYGEQTIHDAVLGDIRKSNSIYGWVDSLVRELGADISDQVPFEKYANAAKSLLKPSSAARAIAAGAKSIERVDLLIQTIAKSKGMTNGNIDTIVSIVNLRLSGQNPSIADLK